MDAATALLIEATVRKLRRSDPEIWGDYTVDYFVTPAVTFNNVEQSVELQNPQQGFIVGHYVYMAGDPASVPPGGSIVTATVTSRNRTEQIVGTLSTLNNGAPSARPWHGVHLDTPTATFVQSAGGNQCRGQVAYYVVSPVHKNVTN